MKGAGSPAPCGHLGLAGGAAGGSLHRLCSLYVAEPFLEMNVWDFPVENYFT